MARLKILSEASYLLSLVQVLEGSWPFSGFDVIS